MRRTMTTPKIALDDPKEDVAVRSLRRRFWKALQEEDGRKALQVYRATRKDWERWICQEEIAEAEQRKLRQPSLAKLRKRRQQKPASIQTVSTDSTQDSLDFGLLQTFMNPSDPFIHDDYRDPNDKYDELQVCVPQLPPRKRTQKRQAKQRLIFWGRAQSFQVDETDDAEPPVDVRMTTPLHQAARLGNSELLRLMLEFPDVDPNQRDGRGRTALHMVAGGLTNSEASYLKHYLQKDHIDIGLLRPEPIVYGSDEIQHEHIAATQAKKAARALGRFIREGLYRESCANERDLEFDKPCQNFPSGETWSHQVGARFDSGFAILQYCHEDDGTARAGEGIAVNCVDNIGRTALHYAAELGREDICMAILSSFGAILTVVDDGGRTPCELASEGNHLNLAAQLEARALLYYDPYGLDDELLAQFTNARSGKRSNLVPPFSWFETWSMREVKEERELRVRQTIEGISKTIEMKLKEITAKEVAYGQVVNLTPQKSNISSDDNLKNFDDVWGSVGSNQTSDSSTLDDVPRMSEDYERFSGMHEKHVEVFLAHHLWDTKKALTAFFDDPFVAFDEAGVPLAVSSQDSKPPSAKEPNLCLICCDVFDSGSSEWLTLKTCGHSFCADCLGEYITDCALTNSHGLVICCPHHECQQLLDPSEIVQLCQTEAIYEKLVSTSNNNFVVSARDLRFCPHPGCDCVVKFKNLSTKKIGDLEPGVLELVGACCVRSPRSNDCRMSYEGVPQQLPAKLLDSTPPLKAHRFCFVCGDLTIHWPVPCDILEDWKNTIREHVKEVDGEEGATNHNEIAQKLWMKANTRPCPKCKAPIEKNEGCNHVTCTNPHCNHEFCWICRKDWKLHSTETGGYFRCNRWVDEKEHQFYDKPPDNPKAVLRLTNEDLSDPTTMEATYGTAMHNARISGRTAREMGRFLHHYERWSAHAESAVLEKKMSSSVNERLAPVIRAAIDFSGVEDFDFGGAGISFIYSAFTELLECRSLLQNSYAFSFFRYNTKNVGHFRLLGRRLQERISFEQLQSELEIMTEQMSDVVARSRLRATQTQITFLTAAAADKRKDFSNLMVNILAEQKKEHEMLLERSGGVSGSKKSRTSLSLPPGILESIVEPRKPRSRQSLSDVMNSSSADIDEAIRTSLQDFMTDSGFDPTAAYDRGDEATDWTCSACTYVNYGGERCMMCGSGQNEHGRVEY